MRKKDFAVIVIGFMLIISTVGVRFAYAAGPAPVVAEKPSASHPAIPSGLKVTCLNGPNTLDPCPTCPVIQWCGYTYWAYSYYDNRVGLAIVAYDASGNIMRQWEKTGARYVYKITVDNAAQTVTFWGQANQSIMMAWKELFPPPVVKTVDSGSHPTIPSGLKVTCLNGPNTLDPCPTCPVIQWCGYTYWAYSYYDNRVGLAIVAYDTSGNIMRQWEKTGARYVYKITVDNAAQTVTFWGQANQSIVMAWKELFPPAPLVKAVSSTSSLPIPPGLKVECSDGPNTLDPCPTCPVIQWCGYTYWAYSYIDNRVGMDIVAYDDSGAIGQQWEKTGARYVYKITVDNAAQTVTFWGQANQTIVMKWKELGYPW